jgi:hypothetical protein
MAPESGAQNHRHDAQLMPEAHFFFQYFGQTAMFWRQDVQFSEVPLAAVRPAGKARHIPAPFSSTTAFIYDPNTFSYLQ